MAQAKKKNRISSRFSWEEIPCLELFDKANDLIQSVDVRGGYLYVNKKWCKTLGYTKKEALNLNFKDVIRKDELKHCQKIFAGLKKGKTFDFVETVFKTKKGQDVFVEGNLSFFKKSEKKIFTIGIFRDVTKRKRIKQRFENIANLTNDWSWEVDKKGKYTHVSGQYKDILVYNKNELLGASPFDFMEKKEAERIKKTFKQAITQKKEIKDLENWNISKKGEKVSLLTSGLPLFGGSGEVIGYQGADKDITREKKLQEELKEKEETFRELFNNMRSGVAILKAENKGTKFYFEDLNRAGERIEDTKKEKIIGKEIREIFPQAVKLGLFKELKNVYKTGESSFLPRLKYQTEKGENYRELYIYKVSEQEKVGIIYKDISDKIEKHKILQESEEKFRAITEASREAIIMLNEQEKIVLWNKAAERMLGYKSSEAQGKNFYNLTGTKKLKNFQQKQEKQKLDLRLKRKNGSGFQAEISFSRSNVNNKSCEILMIRDITEREKYEQKILNEQKNIEKLNRQLEAAMTAGNFAWWEMSLPSGRVEFSENKAEMLGYNPDQFKKYEDFTSWVHPDDYDRVMKAMKDHLQGKSDNYRVDYRIKHKSGSYMWFKDVGQIVEEKGEEKKVVGVVVDITEDKKREKKSKQQMEEMERINKLMTGRELKMIELKEELEELKKKLGES